VKKNINTNLVFLHGWGGCWQSWFPIIKALEKDYTIFAPDLPGHGLEKIEKVLTLSDYSNFVKKYLKDNQIKNPVLIGHSFGGAIICDLLIKNPELSSKIILVDAAPIRHTPSNKQKIISFVSKSLNKISFLRDIGYQIADLKNSDYYQIKNPLLKQTFSTVIREDLSNKLKNIKAKTLIIWGEDDTDTPLTDGLKIQKLIPRSTIKIIKNTGHFSYLDNQSEFITEVKNFIES